MTIKVACMHVCCTLCEDLLRSKRVNKILCPMSTTVWSNYLRVLDLDFEFAVKEKLII